MAPPDAAPSEPDDGTDHPSSAADAGERPALPLEVLERNLVAHRARMAADEARWLDWLRDYDQREGWREWGCTSAAHWLSWKCAMGTTAARERVRVARAMPDLPVLSEAFRSGRLTWSKMRALTRVANIDNEADLAAIAPAATGAQLERICAALRPRPDLEASPHAAFASRGWTRRRNHDGTSTYTLRVVDDTAAAIDAHLDRQVTEIIDDTVARADASMLRREAIAERGGIAAVRADAAGQLLTGSSELASNPRPVNLIVDADAHEAHQSMATVPPDDSAETPTGQAGDEQRAGSMEQPRDQRSRRAPDDSAETSPGRFVIDGHHVSDAVGLRLCCDPRITPLLESALRSSVSVGRTTRLVPASMRLALGQRDGHACRFPGCHATSHLHAHHITHWAHGGETELDNLVLLCHFHHHLVHDGGWRVTHDFDFIRPDGPAADPLPDLLRHEPDLTQLEPSPHDTLARYGPLDTSRHDSLDLAWASAVIADNEALERTRRLAAATACPNDAG